MRILPTLAAATLATAGILTAAAPAGAAASATIDILTTTLAARGAAADISFGVDCPAGYTGSATVAVAQVHDGLTATGTAVEQINCTGTGLLYLQRVTADISGAPYARGKATLAIQVVACDAESCFSTPYNAEIKLTR